MRDVIENLLSLLDADQDWLLVTLLTQRLKNENEWYNSKHSYSYREKRNAHRGMVRMLQNFQQAELREDSFTIKAEKIMQRNSCEFCPFSKTRTHFGKHQEYYYQVGDDTDRCRRCEKRKDTLQDAIDDREKYLQPLSPEQILESTDYEHVLEYRTMLNKLRTKIRDYVTR